MSNGPHQVPRQPDASARATVPVGTMIAGRYLLERVIGEGGMGFVYAALALNTRQRVAIKFLRPEIVQESAVVARFLNEARALVSIASDHVVRVFEVGDGQDGRPPYIVMEYLEGEDLAQLLDREGALTPHVAADYMLQACIAVSEAHAVGIVHRDIKPANFWVTIGPEGPHLKLLDFGIAKAEAPATNQRLTETTTTFGSPTYMSPEQVRSAKHVDLRSDIWALGVVAYELLSGRVPFESATAGGTLAAIIADDVPPLTSPRGPLPPHLVDTVRLALAKKRDQRYPTVAAFAQELARFATPEGRHALARVRVVAAPDMQGSAADWSTESAIQRLSATASGELPVVSAYSPRHSDTLVTTAAILDTKRPLRALAAGTSVVALGAVAALIWATKFAHQGDTAVGAAATAGEAQSGMVPASAMPSGAVAAPTRLADAPSPTGAPVAASASASASASGSSPGRPSGRAGLGAGRAPHGRSTATPADFVPLNGGPSSPATVGGEFAPEHGSAHPVGRTPATTSTNGASNSRQ